jgi:Cu(I)/Ag(I) efflux system membrane fusion protein
MYLAYFGVQMALANDSLAGAKDAFSRLKKSTEAVDMELFSGEAHMRWMKISKAIIAASADGAAAGDLVAARDAFYCVSQVVIELHDSYGHAVDGSFYLTFCPMARDNQGAFWLQQENIVWNSFYGEAMLRCGEIKKELTAD